MDASTRRQEVNSMDADGAMTDGRAMVPCPAPISLGFFSNFVYVMLFLEEKVFGSAWRLVWSRAVESLFDAPRLAFLCLSVGPTAG